MLCGCIGEKTIKDCISAIKKAQEDGADLIELRIDHLDNRSDFEKIITDSSLPVLATNRGGDQKLLIKAIEVGAKYIDMDIDEIDESVLIFAKEKNCRVILSYHNFKETPSRTRLLEISKILRQSGADILKIVITPKLQQDNEIILSLYQKVDLPLIAFGMGELGQETRTGCLAHGALWTYCSVGGNKIASGQISLKEVRAKKLYCLIGNPLGHTMSPAMHNANFKALNINAKYIATPVINLKEFINTFKTRGISGANVTMPYKVEVMKYLDKTDSLSKEIGAVNTIQNKNGELTGYNTDGYGALLSIKEKIKNIEGKRIIILGSGGAARAIYFTLKQEKADLIILAREGKEAKKIGEFLLLNDKNLEAELEKADILINCTPIGMDKDESLVPKEYLRKDLTVFDIVYNPLKTRLIKEAESAGCQTILGYKMLVYQGAKSFSIWTGNEPNLPAMMGVVKKNLLPNIALIGFMGSGKTSVGKLLAKELDRNFVDTDDEIEKEAKIKVSEIFAEHGEEHFRKMETFSLEEILRKKNLIISCGGGIILSERNREMLRSCLVFLLKAELEIIIGRLKNDTGRPLIKGGDAEKIEKIKKIMDEREDLYISTADYVVKTDNDGKEKRVQKIVELINKI